MSKEPAAFFAAPPQTPSDLVAARQGLMQDPVTAEKFAAAVREARNSGNVAVAAAGSWVTGEYSKALDLVQGSGELAAFIRGASLYELERFHEAVKVLRAGVASRDVEFAAAALHALDAAHEYQALAESLTRANLKPIDRKYFEARLQEIEGSYAEACGAYTALLSDDRYHFASRFRLAARADLLGDDEEAIRHYEELLHVRPIAITVLINLGILYEDRGEFARACGCYDAVLKRDPTNQRARLYYRDARESLTESYDEDQVRKEDRLRQILQTPISEFELSVRARNCLANMNIRTLGDLVAHSEQDLLSLKNVGDTTLNEIRRLLSLKNLRLGLRREDGSYIIPPDFVVEPEKTPAVEQPDVAFLGILSDEQREALDKPISTLNLSVRCHRALVERLNLQRIGDILRYTEEELLAQPNFGITSMKELNTKLLQHNLRLRTGRGDEYGGEE